MKKGVKVFLCLLSVLLATLLTYACLVCAYYARYRENAHEAVFAEKPLSKGEIRVMSCNLRCMNVLDPAKKSWFYRADLIIKNIENEAPVVIGFQEATKWQYSYLCSSLPGYDSVITYRDKSLASEGCPIFYQRSLYDLIDKGSFWLSETPDEMSKDWGAACYRICSYVILRDKETGLEFVVFNTHLDHISDTARINGIGVVLDKISQFGSLPSIIMGDFNAEEDSETYRSATENFFDVKYQTENTMQSCTYQNWGQSLDRNCIDYIMISQTGFSVNSYEVVRSTYENVYPSDHFPLVASLTLIGDAQS